MKFETVYNQHYQRLYTLAFRMTGNKEDSEDVLQTAFLNAYKAFDKFRHESSVYTWLYRIVVNTANRLYNKISKLPVDEYSEANNISQADAYKYINSFGRVEDEAVVKLVRETCLQMFMNCMPPKYRSVYILRVVLNFSVKEASDILDVSENAVKTNLSRARKLIKDHMSGRCSLIKPGSACDCRSYAKYYQEKSVKKLPDIQTIKKNEKVAVEQFHDELSELLKIDELFNTHIKAPEYPGFLKRIKQAAKEKNISLLDY